METLPLFVDKDGTVMTQYPYGDVDAIGLIKFDFLGLKTLTLIAKTVERIKVSRGVSLDVSELPLDDAATFQLITRGDTVGVFQLESSGMRKLVTALRPSTFEDLIAVLALFRPGPLDSGMVDQFIKRKHGQEPIRYLHPALEPILRETYGVILYQEQVMQIAQVLAGYTLGDADNLRRAMGKKKKDEMERERQRFISGAVARGVAKELAGEIFDQMETFAAYGFNKSHSAAYALISYQTAYLKAHFTEEFMAALLSLEMDSTEKTYKNIAECRELQIPVLPPDVNESALDFTVLRALNPGERQRIRFGLGAVKGVGAKAIEAIVQARAEGPFVSLADFCSRVNLQQVNKRVLENLIKCGAFDFTGEPRRRMVESLDAVLRWAGAVAENGNSSQITLFGTEVLQAAAAPPAPPDVPEWDGKERLRYERETLGFFITGHPLERWESEVRRWADGEIAKLAGKSNGSKVRVAGVIQSVKTRNTKKGERYAGFVLEDRSGTVEVLAWPEAYRKSEAAIHGDEPVLVEGTLEVDEERCQIFADAVTRLIDVRERNARQLHLAIRAGRVERTDLERLRDTLARHQGSCLAVLHVFLPGDWETVLALPPNLTVSASEELVSEIEQLLGEGSVFFQ
jgi:DNA polymerase-3 subunit alpha